jgi:hypothetical protein
MARVHNNRQQTPQEDPQTVPTYYTQEECQQSKSQRMPSLVCSHEHERIMKSPKQADFLYQADAGDKGAGWLFAAKQ